MPTGVNFSIPATNGSAGHATTQTSLFLYIPSAPSGNTTIFDYDLSSGDYFRLRLATTRHLWLEYQKSGYGSATADLGAVPVATWTWITCGFKTSGGLYLRGDLTPLGSATSTVTALASSGSATGTTLTGVPFGVGVTLTSAYADFPNDVPGNWLCSKLIQTQISSNAAAGNPEPMPVVDFLASADYREYLAHDALGAAASLTDSGTAAIDLIAGTQGLTIADAGPSLLPSSPGPGGAHEGDLTYYHTGTWQNLHAGSTGQALTIASGDPAWGTIPQTTVETDLVEAATNDTITSGSRLLNNLNKIRYQLAQLGTGAWNTLRAMVQLSPSSQQTGTINVSGEIQGSDLKAGGLTGATQASRYVGATTSGAPTSGTFAKGDFVLDQTGQFWVCTTAGTPGTWTLVAGSGGSVTSVGLTMPAEFTVAGSPITGAGTLAVTKANESANQIFSGPTTGAAAAPTFRSMVSADLPSAPTVSGEVTASDFKPTGLGNATAAVRFVGGTASAAPTTGTFAVGDYVITQAGSIYICTVAGTPGTWTQVSGGGGASPLTTKGDLYGYSTVDARLPVGSDGTFLAADSSQSTGLAYKFPAGVAGVSTLSNTLSADVTLTSANTFYDGPSLTLSPGTWLLTGTLSLRAATAGGNADLLAKLWDGTTSYDSGDITTQQAWTVSIPLTAIVSPATTTTYKLSGASSSASSFIKAAGNTLLGNNSSYLQAVQLTGAPASGPGALMPAVHAYNSADISVANTTITALGLNSTRFDQGTSTPQHSTSTNTSRLTCQQAGMYQITGEVQYDGNATGTARQVRLHVNGTLVDYVNLPPNSTAFTTVPISLLWQLNVGDYVELEAYQDSGGALLVKANANSPFLSMARIDSGPGAVQPNTKVQLQDIPAASDVANGVSLPATTWTDLRVNQTFTVDDASSVIEICPSVAMQITGASASGQNFAARIVIDSGGTPITRVVGMIVASSTGGQSSNPFSGAGTEIFTGLSAGSHTVKVQVYGTVSGTMYCRPNTQPDIEAYSLAVLERKQSSSPPSSTPAPAVRCYNSADISLANITVTYLTFDTNRVDQGTSTSQHSTSSNTDRLTCQQAGFYSISALAQCTGFSSGVFNLRLRLNGSTVIAVNGVPGTTDGPYATVSAFYYLNVGDYVEVGAYQTSGSTQTVKSFGNYSPEFMMARIDTGALPSQQWITKSVDYTILSTDYGGILADATSGNRTMTLPTAVGAWQEFTVKKLDSSANTVTVATTSSQTIDGASTYVISTQYESVTVVSNNANWFIK